MLAVESYLARYQSWTFSNCKFNDNDDDDVYVNRDEDYFDDDGMIGSNYYIIYGHFKSNFATTSLYIMETEFLYQAINIVETITGNDIKENY